MTIEGNGSIQNNKGIGVASANGTITIESGTYTSTVDVPFRANENGKVVLNDGTIYGREGGITAPSGHGSIEINGGLIDVSDNFAVATNGTAGRGDNLIVVNGGTLIGNIESSGYEAIGVYVANSDTFIMNGGEIIANGGTGLCMRGGNVIINDGTITATNTNKSGENVPDGKIADKDTIMFECAGVIYHESADYPGKAGMKLTINGGTITGADHSVQILSNEENPNVEIHGGTLTPSIDQIYDSNSDNGSDEEWTFDANGDGEDEERQYDAGTNP